MTFTPWERWISNHFGIQVSCEQAFDLASGQNPFGLAVRQLNPVVNKIVGDPVNELINSTSSRFSESLFLFMVEDATDNPVVGLFAKDFSSEPDLVTTTQCS